jgi:methionine sulfoxide reductase heme-binding subunit
MRNWIYENGLWLLLNLCALIVIMSLLIQINEFRFFTTAPFSSFSERPDIMMESGKWAFRFLLLSLAITPLNTFFAWRAGIRLRKPAGLWAFAFGLLHFVLFLAERFPTTEWFSLLTQNYILLGLVALTILTALALTSTRWAMKHLGKNWKRLHRFVYAAGALIALHSLLAINYSKKMLIAEPTAPQELGIYTLILVILLIVRIPIIRASVVKFRTGMLRA